VNVELVGVHMSAEVTTKLAGVDIPRGVVSYIVSKPSIYTTYTTVTNYVTYNLRTYYSILTAVRRTYVLPDGSPYTVVNIPTKIVVASRIETIPVKVKT